MNLCRALSSVVRMVLRCQLRVEITTIQAFYLVVFAVTSPLRVQLQGHRRKEER